VHVSNNGEYRYFERPGEFGRIELLSASGEWVLVKDRLLGLDSLSNVYSNFFDKTAL